MDLIINKIKEYDRIIIHRHKRPDMDALGSQKGLGLSIKKTFPNKEVYIVGDMNKYQFLGEMDIINDKLYEDALVIIVDVAVSDMISDDRYNLAKEVLIIDHHENLPNVNYTFKYIDKDYTACAELIANMLYEYDFVVDNEVATALMSGIITDSGRFLYSIDDKLIFDVASKLVNSGADLKFIYDNLYVEKLSDKKMKAYFTEKFEVTENNVAYLINKLDVFQKFDCDVFTISRGMVSVMSGIEDIFIWVNFTYDRDNNCFLAEFRSRDVSVLDIAKSYGGGGHEFACGAKLYDIDVVMEVLKKLDERAKWFNEQKGL